MVTEIVWPTEGFRLVLVFRVGAREPYTVGVPVDENLYDVFDVFQGFLHLQHLPQVTPRTLYEINDYTEVRVEPFRARSVAIATKGWTESQIQDVLKSRIKEKEFELLAPIDPDFERDAQDMVSWAYFTLTGKKIWKGEEVNEDELNALHTTTLTVAKPIAKIHKEYWEKSRIGK